MANLAMSAASSTRSRATGERFPLRRISLRFVDPQIEREYRKVDIEQNRPLIRTYLIAAAALYLVFGLLDLQVAGAATDRLLFVRSALVAPVLVGIALATYLPRFVDYAQKLLIAATAASGLGIVYMTAVLDGPARGEYYAGLIMVVIYGSALVRLRSVNAFLVSATLIALYQPVAIAINPIPAKELLSNDFFLIMAASVGVLSGFLQEVAVRNSFRSTKLLELKNQEAENLLLHAQAASRAKDDFVANMSHELRTPLNAIIGFSQIMEEKLYGRLGDPRYEEYAGYIQRSGKHLLDIINSVLDFAKADAGKLKLHETPCDIGACVKDAVVMCSELAKTAGVKLALSGATGLIAQIDERLVRQSLLNLISNAIKFSPRDTKIEIMVDHSEDGLAISVTDHGIGIAEENIQRILRPFEQVESTYSRAHGGTGLGLPLAQKFMELHGGGLEIASRLNEGTTVTLRLPAGRLCSPANAPAAAIPALRKVG
jgi:signal transduction histidine kinase